MLGYPTLLKYEGGRVGEIERLHAKWNFMWMCSLCRLPVAKNHNFWANFDIWGTPVPNTVYWWRSNFVCWRRPKVFTYIRNFMWMCSLCWLRRPKPTILDKFWHLGSSCTDSVLPMRSKFSAACARADPWCTLRAKFRLDRFILSLSGSDKTQIFPFFGLRHFVVSPIAAIW